VRPLSFGAVFENSSHFFLVEEAEKFQGVLSDWLSRHAA
jgi:hypothetical protein